MESGRVWVGGVWEGVGRWSLGVCVDRWSLGGCG